MTPSPLDDLATQRANILTAIAALASLDELRDAEPSLIGRRSVLATMQRSLGSLDPEERRDAGALLQEARRGIEAALESRREELRGAERAVRLEADRLDLGDVVVSDVRWPVAAGHPGLVATTQRSLEDV